jgi:hypothetical protein
VYDTSRQSSTSTAARARETASATSSSAVAPRSNQDAVAAAGLASLTSMTGADGLLDALAGMGEDATVVLDAMPIGKAIEVARQLTSSPAVGAWLADALGQDSGGTSTATAGGVHAEGSVFSMMLGWAGCDTEEPADMEALATQTAENFLHTTGKLREVSGLARSIGEVQSADVIDKVLANVGGAESLVEQLTAMHAVKEDFVLLRNVVRTSQAAYVVDMKDPDAAAAAFDAWFEAVGGLGERLTDVAGPWGPILKPYATFVKSLGQSGFFQRMPYGRYPHGAGPGTQTERDLAELNAEGY